MSLQVAVGGLCSKYALVNSMVECSTYAARDDVVQPGVERAFFNLPFACHVPRLRSLLITSRYIGDKNTVRTGIPSSEQVRNGSTPQRLWSTRVQNDAATCRRLGPLVFLNRSPGQCRPQFFLRSYLSGCHLSRRLVLSLDRAIGSLPVVDGFSMSFVGLYCHTTTPQTDTSHASAHRAVCGLWP